MPLRQGYWLARGRANGVEGLECLDRKSIRALEPEVEARMALYSRETGMLYLVGTSTNAEPFVRTFYNVIDPTTGQSVETLSIDRFKPSALAAVPEPNFVMGVTACSLVLALTARRRPRRAD